MDQIAAFRHVLAAYGDQWPETDNDATSIGHMYFMLERMERNADTTAPDGFSEAKKGRWLGYMQGVACALGVIDLDALKEINKQFADAPQPSDEMLAARQLADLVLSMQFATGRGLSARKLARQILGITDCGMAPDMAVITTNGTTRLIPTDEPVFLLRAQDIVSGDVVRYWAASALTAGADPEIVRSAREQAAKMDAWPKKKVPDLPASIDSVP